MLVFWKQGYEGSSLADLTAAMGVTPPSVYSAYGDKKSLFLEAVDRYVGDPAASDTIIDESLSSRDAAERLLHAAAVGFTGDKTPAGCLLASAAISCSRESEDVKRKLAAIRRRIEKKLREKILADIDSGRLPKGCDDDALAGHTMAVIQGMSTLARDGAKREKLLRLVTAALRAWPST